MLTLPQLHLRSKKSDKSSCVIIVIAPGWPGMPWFWDLVQLSTGITLQLPVSRILKQSHNYVFHSNPQHFNLHAWCLGVDSAKNKASLWGWQRELQRLSTRIIYNSKFALFEKWYSENSIDFSTPSIKQVSDFFMYLCEDLNRLPSTIDGHRMAIVDPLGPTGLHISQRSDLNRLLSSFHRDCPKSSRIFLSGTFLLFPMSSQKHLLSLWMTQTSNILLSKLHSC